ncbi:RES family NAD+ phosphorylase [Propionivibrio sp.]|uniref:RES family NAD+ phosphorylase n=1 Tax=Propionivibrio sp. TaxID=2212460 RepID=UPI003BF392DB
MIEHVFSAAGLAETHGDLVRNIVSIRVSQDLFDDLSPDPQDWNSAIELERSTKPAVFSSHVPVIDRPFEEAIWNDAINYPFTHWMRSRFSDGSYGVWYGADGIETTIHETAFHWRSGFLRDAGYLQPGITIERKIYQVRCDAALVDLRLAAQRFPSLVHPEDYTLPHQVGAKIHREGHPGLVSPSARTLGSVYAVFNPKVLADPRHAGFLTYSTTRTGIAVEREPGVVLLEI